MAVNESIWGTKANWELSSITGLSSTTGMTVDDKYKVYQGNFGQGTATYQSYGSLAKGFAANKVKLNEMIDKSMCYCALGAESPFSKIRYINTRTMAVEAMDNRTKTDFCFAVDRYTGLTNTPREIRQTLNTSSSNFNDDMRSRWSPNVTLAQPAYNGYLEPIIQFSPKNFVLLIQLTAVSDLNAGSTGSSQTYTLDEYINGEHYIDYPYITHVGLRPCLGRNDIADRTSTISNAPAIMVLEPLSIGAKLHDINNTPLTNYIDYDICIGGNNNRIVFTLMGQGRYGGLQWNTNGYISKNTSTTIDYFRPIYGENFVKHDIVDSDATRWYMPYSEENIESIRKATACFGLFFTGDLNTAQSGSYTDEKMYMGILEDGIGHGKYTQGVLNPRNKQWDWNSSGDSDYKPGGGSKPYDAKTTAHRRIAPQGIAGQWYCLPLFSLDDTATWFQRIMTTINSTRTGEENNFYGQNPIDCIIEAREVYLPQSFAGWDTTSSVLIGDLIINSGELPNVRKSSFITPINYDCGTIHIDEVYGDFRDYEPYTQIQLYIPFCGIVDLKPSVCTGHDITLEEEIEFTTGDILANIYVDNCLYTTINGNCASDMSLNGLAISNYAQIRSSYLQKGASDLLSAGASAISGIAGGTIAASYGNTAGVKAQQWAGGLTAAQGIISAIHDFDMYSNLHPAPIKIQNGSPSPQSNSVFNPFIIVQYPLEFDNFDISEFIKLNGVACYDTGKLSDIAKGITVCSEYDLSGIHCTEEEKQMIAHLLESGVIV